MRNTILIITFILIQFFFIKINQKTVIKDSVKIDSVLVIKKIPEIKRETIFLNPKKVKEYVYINNGKDLIKTLEKQYNKKIDSLVLINELLKMKVKKVYKQQLNDSLVNIEATVKSSGKVDFIKLKYELKERNIQHYEKTITKKVYPKFRILGGVSTNFNSVNFNLSLQNKKGNIYGIGYDTNGNINIEYKYNLFTKY